MPYINASSNRITNMNTIFVFVALVAIVASEIEVSDAEGSYKFSFETADGVKREEEGAQKKIGDEEGATKRGSFSYNTPEGEKISLTFVADENGFQPEGAHLPVAPEPSPAR